MRLEDLKLFRDIATERSVSRGAELNDVTQSAASQHLLHLESRFRAPLLDRSVRPLAVTPAGRLYLDFCQRVLRMKDELDDAMAGLRPAEQSVEGIVHFATIYSVGLSEVTTLRAEFERRHPKAHLAIEYLRPERVYDALLSDRADLGVVSYPQKNKEIAIIPWRQEEMVAAMSPNHPLAGFPTVHPSQLEGMAFIAFDEELPIAKHIDRYLRAQRVGVRRVMHFDNIDSLREAVAQGSGIAIMPKTMTRAFVEQGRLVASPLVPKPLRRPLGIVHRRKKKFSRAAQAFLDLLRESALPVARA